MSDITIKTYCSISVVANTSDISHLAVDVNPDVLDRGDVRVRLTSVGLSFNPETGNETLRGRGLQLRKDGTVGTRERTGIYLRDSDLPEAVLVGLRYEAARAAATLLAKIAARVQAGK